GHVHEAAKPLVGDREPIDPEAVDADLANGTLLGIVVLRSHAERAAGDPHHVPIRSRARKRSPIDRLPDVPSVFGTRRHGRPPIDPVSSFPRHSVAAASAPANQTFDLLWLASRASVRADPGHQRRSFRQRHSFHTWSIMPLRTAMTTAFTRSSV